MSDIVIKNLSHRFQDTVVFQHFNAVIKHGGVTCIMGSSGCGKTTLARMLLGLQHPDSGSIENVFHLTRAAVFQRDVLIEPMSAVGNIELVLPRSSATLALLLLALLGLRESAAKPVSALSGGMRRRVAIARAVAPCREFIVMDEPFKGLDDDTKALTIDFVKKHTHNKTLLIVTHDKEDIDLLGADVLSLN